MDTIKIEATLKEIQTREVICGSDIHLQSRITTLFSSGAKQHTEWKTNGIVKDCFVEISRVSSSERGEPPKISNWPFFVFGVVLGVLVCFLLLQQAR